MLVPLLLSLVVVAGGSTANSTDSRGSTGYCSSNTFDSNSTFMHFTKEPVPVEYAYQDKFKSIHCCVKGYRSIEWFKDGVSYPWSAGVSNLILYPEAANQTLYTRKATRSDSGNYTCRLSNETHVQTHTLRLDVLEKPMDAPKMMYLPTDQWVEEGARLRLFCEALIGQSLLADSYNDLRWRKEFPNGTDGDLLDSQVEVRTTREDEKDILGSYLTIDHVSAQDYGTYACVVNNNNRVSKQSVTVHYKSSYSAPWSAPWSGGVSWRAAAGGAAAALLAAASLLAAHRRCTPRLLLAARHARARAATAVHRARVLEKELDVLVCYSSVDGELVRGALLYTLTHKYHYRVQGLQLSNHTDNWCSEISLESGRSRSCVVVVSPASLARSELVAALRGLRASRPRPRAVVLLQDLPKLKLEAKECGESASGLVRGLRLLAWRHVHDARFWTELRLALPLPPATTAAPSKETDEKGKGRSGSMTALV